MNCDSQAIERGPAVILPFSSWLNILLNITCATRCRCLKLMAPGSLPELAGDLAQIELSAIFTPV